MNRAWTLILCFATVTLAELDPPPLRTLSKEYEDAHDLEIVRPASTNDIDQHRTPEGGKNLSPGSKEGVTLAAFPTVSKRSSHDALYTPPAPRPTSYYDDFKYRTYPSSSKTDNTRGGRDSKKTFFDKKGATGTLPSPERDRLKVSSALPTTPVDKDSRRHPLLGTQNKLESDKRDRDIYYRGSEGRALPRSPFSSSSKAKRHHPDFTTSTFFSQADRFRPYPYPPYPPRETSWQANGGGRPSKYSPNYASGQGHFTPYKEHYNAGPQETQFGTRLVYSSRKPYASGYGHNNFHQHDVGRKWYDHYYGSRRPSHSHGAHGYSDSGFRPYLDPPQYHDRPYINELRPYDHLFQWYGPSSRDRLYTDTSKYYSSEKQFSHFNYPNGDQSWHKYVRDRGQSTGTGLKSYYDPRDYEYDEYRDRWHDIYSNEAEPPQQFYPDYPHHFQPRPPPYSSSSGGDYPLPSVHGSSGHTTATYARKGYKQKFIPAKDRGLNLGDGTVVEGSDKITLECNFPSDVNIVSVSVKVLHQFG